MNTLKKHTKSKPHNKSTKKHGGKRTKKSKTMKRRRSHKVSKKAKKGGFVRSQSPQTFASFKKLLGL